MESLYSERLVLRQWRESDVHDFHEYAKSELVGPNAGWKPHKDEEESKAIVKMFIKNNDTYAIVLKSEDKVIGSIGLHKRKPDEGLEHLEQREIGYALNHKYWGHGYVPEAVNCILSYGFNKLNLDLIWCGHFDYNHNSKRVNEKCGFRYKFTKYEKIKALDDKEFKVLYYNILKDEYVNNQ